MTTESGKRGNEGLDGIGNTLDEGHLLESQRSKILRIWEARVRALEPAAQRLDTQSLLNHIPKFLATLVDALKGNNAAIPPSRWEEIPKEHGEQRAQLEGYSLELVIGEFQILREVIFEVLEEHAPLTPRARDTILKAMDRGVKCLVAAYSKAELEREKGTEERREELARLLDLTHDAVLVRDEHDKVLYWNRGAELIFGYSSAEAVGKVTHELLQTRFPEPLAEIEAKFKQSGFWSGELVHTLKDGRRVVSMSRWSRDQAPGRPLRVLESNFDVTYMKAAESELRQSEQLFRTIFDLAAAGKAVLDFRTGRFLKVNRKFCEMLGYSESELLTKTYVDVTHPEDRAWQESIYREHAAAELPWSVEKRYVRKDGATIWVLVSGAVLERENGKTKTTISTLFDITGRKRVERELRTEKEMRERFTNALAHDLRTPLTSAKLSTQMVLRGDGITEKQEKQLAGAVESINRVDSMITDLLDASRIRAGKRIALKVGPCDLRIVLEHSVRDMSLIHGARFRLEGPAHARGEWSCEELRRVFDNLLGNAVKYGAKNSVITARFEERGDEVLASVHNFGNPIPPEDCEHLFDMFRRSAAVESAGHQGWGIGLTLVKGIVEAHGGSVKVESREGEGTTFFVRLPKNTNSSFA